MNKKFFLSVLIILFFTAGCGKNYELPLQETETSNSDQSDPFETSASEVVGAVAHNVSDPALNNDGSIAPFIYTGGQMEINYSFQVEGKGDTVGFLMFINGKPQPYMVDSTEKSEYCHFFDITSEKQNSFTFKFTPIDGKKGETISLAIASIYNPSFSPDMKNTSSYGWYHRILDNQYMIEMQADAPKEENDITNIVSNISAKTDKITETFLSDNLAVMGWDGITTEDLGKQTFYEITYNGKISNDNIDIEKSDQFHITYKLCGSPGVKYVTTIFLNHSPIFPSDSQLMETELSKGDISTIDIELDVKKMKEFSTFYIISVPQNAQEFPNENAMVIKTNSILLYKE